MPLDHYVSQTHLKKFYTPGSGARMYAVKKSDGEKFQCDSKSVCRTKDGNTNPYLVEERLVEYILRDIEPRYNLGLEQVQSRALDRDGILGIAGFAAYVATCSPTAMRLGTSPLSMMLEALTRAMDAKGGLPPFPDDPDVPENYRGKSMSELQGSDLIFDIDPKYPQAIGIDGMNIRVSRWANCGWSVYRNDFEDSPFFTSDFPVAIQQSVDARVLDRVVPLSPSLALVIHPDLATARAAPDLTFGSLRVRYLTASHHDVVSLNRQIVRCGEELVFYRDERPWVEPFIRKNSAYRIEAEERRYRFGSREVRNPAMVLRKRHE